MNFIDEAAFRSTASRKAFFAKLRTGMRFYGKGENTAADFLKVGADKNLHYLGHELRGSAGGKVMGAGKVPGQTKNLGDKVKLVKRLKSVTDVKSNPNFQVPRKAKIGGFTEDFTEYLTSGKSKVAIDKMSGVDDKQLTQRHSELRSALAGSKRMARNSAGGLVTSERVSVNTVVNKATKEQTSIVAKGLKSGAQFGENNQPTAPQIKTDGKKLKAMDRTMNIIGKSLDRLINHPKTALPSSNDPVKEVGKKSSRERSFKKAKH